MTPTFHLFFMHWSHYPPIWMSPSDYQSFIYFRAVSHKKRVYKSVTCHRFLSSPLLEPVCWVTPMTRVFCFLWRGLSPLSPIGIAKKKGYLFLLPSTICLFLIKKYPYKEMCKHICIDVIHSSQNIVSIKTQQGMFWVLKTFWVTLQDSCPNLENLLRNHSFIKHVI